MVEKELRFICDYCKKETTVFVEIAKPLPTQRKDVVRVYYCKYCEKPNKIPVPGNLDVHVFVLGRDKGFLRYTSDGIPLLQGEKDL